MKPIKPIKRVAIALLAALGILSTVLGGLTLARPSGAPPPADNAPLKAAIVDQLYSLDPNPALIASMTRLLEGLGYGVTLHQGAEVTVDFYRDLPGYGYRLIIFRSHLGLLTHVYDDKTVQPESATALFTGEAYSAGKYPAEQLGERVQRAVMNGQQAEVFSVNADFISRDMKGRFDNTAILMMGCSSYYYEDLAQAFLQKGAAVYLGWSASVLLDYLDRATLALVGALSTDGVSIEQAVAQTMAEVGRDPRYNAGLRFNHSASSKKTITGL